MKPPGTGRGRHFYHGTRNAFLEPGDEVVPANEAGNVQSWIGYGRFPTVDLKVRGGEPETVNRQDKVFTTSSEDEAWGWGEQNLLKEGIEDRVENRQTGGRPYVYEVEPINPRLPVEEHSLGEAVSDRARVMRRIDIPPAQTDVTVYDEWQEGSPSAGGEFNPSGPAGRTHARQGELPGRGINWINYDLDSWEGMDEYADESPELAESIKAHTGHSPEGLADASMDRWLQQRAGSGGPPLTGELARRSEELMGRRGNFDAGSDSDPRQMRLL